MVLENILNKKLNKTMILGTRNLFKIAISVVYFAFFLFLAGSSDESSSPSLSPSDSYEEPVTNPKNA